MSSPSATALRALLLCLLVSGCSTTDAGRRPHMTVSDGRLQQIDFAGVDLKFDLTVHNPGDRDLKLDAYHWELTVAGQRLAKGQSRAPQRVNAGTNLVVTIDAPVRNGDIFRAVGSEHPAQAPEYALRLSALLTGGMFVDRGEFNKRGTLPVLYKPTLTLQNFRIAKESQDQATVTFDALLENHNPFAVNLGAITASLNLAGRPVAQEFKTSPRSIPPNGKTVADFELDLDLALLGATVVNALHERDVGYEFSGSTAFDTPWGRKTLNFSQSGRLQIHR
jgi:LEA14-like dessication related protein